MGEVTSVCFELSGRETGQLEPLTADVRVSVCARERVRGRALPPAANEHLAQLAEELAAQVA